MAISGNSWSQDLEKFEESICNMMEEMLQEHNRKQEQLFMGMVSELKTLISSIYSVPQNQNSSPAPLSNSPVNQKPVVGNSSNPFVSPFIHLTGHPNQNQLPASSSNLPVNQNPMMGNPSNPYATSFIDLTSNHNQVANGNNYQVTTRFTKIEFPQFDGEELEGWLFKRERLFQIDVTPQDAKVKLVTIHMKGRALQWHQSFVKNINKEEKPPWEDMTSPKPTRSYLLPRLTPVSEEVRVVGKASQTRSWLRALSCHSSGVLQGVVKCSSQAMMASSSTPHDKSDTIGGASHLLRPAQRRNPTGQTSYAASAEVCPYSEICIDSRSHATKERVGVLLLNLGRPETLNDVQPFLFNLFVNLDIIQLPRLFQFLQRPLAQLIFVLRAPKGKEGYASIGGGSPLHKITDEQAHAIKMALEAKGMATNICVGMRYWYSFTISDVTCCLRFPGQLNSDLRKLAKNLNFRGVFQLQVPATKALKTRILERMVFQGLDYLDLATRSYEYACEKFPNNLELMMGLFNCYVHEYSFVRQLQMTIKMYKLVGEEKFLLSAICSIQLQMFCGNRGEKLLLLAECLLKKYVSFHSLYELEALIVYISILEQQEIYGDVFEILSWKIGSLLMIEVDKLHIQGRLLAKSGDYVGGVNIYQKLVESSNSVTSVTIKVLGNSISIFKIEQMGDIYKASITELEDSVRQMMEMYWKNLPLSKDLNLQESMHGEELLSMACNALVQLFWQKRHLGNFIVPILVYLFDIQQGFPHSNLVDKVF